jgi:polyisoprenoid-binding protein YceI
MSAVQTKTTTFTVDPVHSSIEFLVLDTENMMTTIRGRFTDFEGTIELPEDGDGRITGLVRVASVTTDNEQRDAHLRSPDFFDAENNPEIRFESTRVERASDDTLNVAGTLTIRGTEIPVELPTKIVGRGPDQKGDERIVLTAQGSLEWGPGKVDVSTNVSAVKS